MDSIYIHLHSDGCRDIFPSNNASSFTTQLYKPLKLPPHAYEVGLIDSGLGFVSNKKLFPPDGIDLTASQIIASTEITVNVNKNLQSLLTEINKQSVVKGATLSKEGIALTQKDTILYIDDVLAKILGHS